MRCDLKVYSTRQAAQASIGPGFGNLVCRASRQAWDLAPICSHLGCGIVQVQDEHQRALLELS